MSNTYQPNNSLEKAIVLAKTGALPMKVLVGMLLGSDLILPSTTEVKQDLSGFVPLLFEKDGAKFVAIFTSDPLLIPYREQAGFFVEINGFRAVKRMPPGYGMMLNANTPVALEINADGLAKMVSDFT